MQASGRVAKDAARYSDGLCRAMVRGMVDEMRSRGIWRPGEEGMHAVNDEDGAEAAVGCSGEYHGDQCSTVSTSDSLSARQRGS